MAFLRSHKGFSVSFALKRVLVSGFPEGVLKGLSEGCQVDCSEGHGTQQLRLLGTFFWDPM